MNNWMLCKIKYTKQLENGTFKRVLEPYLLTAVSFTDAESRIYEELGSIIRGEFIVQSIAREDVSDIFHYEDSDVWYKCKVSTQNPDSEKEKEVVHFYYISADSVKQATERLTEQLSGGMLAFEIKAVIKTAIVDVFPYVENLDKEISRKPVDNFFVDRYTERKARLLHEGFEEGHDEEEEIVFEKDGEFISYEDVYSLPEPKFNQKLNAILGINAG